MSNVIKFKTRREMDTDEFLDLIRGKIVVCKAFVEGQGWKRRRWIVSTRFLDGSSNWRDGMRDEKTALFVAEIFSKKYGFPVVNLGPIQRMTARTCDARAISISVIGPLELKPLAFRRRRPDARADKGNPVFGWKAGETRGQIVGAGGYGLSPIPKFDDGSGKSDSSQSTKCRMRAVFALRSSRTERIGNPAMVPSREWLEIGWRSLRVA